MKECNIGKCGYVLLSYSKVFAQYLSCDHIFRESPSKFKVCQMLQDK